MSELHTDCRTEEGITVGLIDSLITIGRILVNRECFHESVQQALKDFRADDDMKRLMDIGDFSSAKDYIEDQKKTIATLTQVLRFVTQKLKEFGGV